MYFDHVLSPPPAPPRVPPPYPLTSRASFLLIISLKTKTKAKQENRNTLKKKGTISQKNAETKYSHKNETETPKQAWGPFCVGNYSWTWVLP